jgi:hypothetical protein
MVFGVIRDVHNDIQKSNKITLPTSDFVFVCVLCAAAFYLCVDICAANMFQRKIIEMFQEKQELPKTQQLKLHQTISLKD